MTTPAGLRFLRPSLGSKSRIANSNAALYARFYDVVRQYSIASARPGGLDQMNRVKESIADYDPLAKQEARQEGSASQREDVKKRIAELEALRALKYPRSSGGSSSSNMTCQEVKDGFDFGKTLSEYGAENLTIRGRVYSIRTAGSKLMFLDIVQDGSRLQVICNIGKLDGSQHIVPFKLFRRVVKRGDIIECVGHPYTTERGENSLRVSQTPTILTPALASLPTNLDDRETLVRNRHVDMLLNDDTQAVVKARARVIGALRTYLTRNDFVEVQTPILARSAGGAVARPFSTLSTEFPDKALSLRIAPELWLKRLIIGGLDKVFEIGPVFRNEGVDGTHNPEFYTCEFYQAFANLEDLMSMTESMLAGIYRSSEDYLSRCGGTEEEAIDGAPGSTTLPLVEVLGIQQDSHTPKFGRIEFIPAIEAAISRKLPNLSSSSAQAAMVELFKDLSLPLPTTPTLPRLLDKLSAHYLEPLCLKATYIIHHPACLAPLAKSFVCPTTGQAISARAELFIKHKEIANMYEEENDPAEQRRKFVEQRAWIDDENKGEVDEGYIEALEWGLPPTGGWGMGIDRLVMLFSGKERIGEVLSFGTLRNVVGLGRDRK